MMLMDLLPIALSFAAALALTPAVRALARRIGMVARPKADRWHTRPTALLGGLAIFAAVALAALLFVPKTPQVVAVLVASGFMFALGLVDDLLNLKPYQKLIGQIVCAAGVVACRLVLPWTGLLPVDMAITMVWLVGITNAVNLLDNMDGLAAGIAAIASAFLALNFLGNGQADEAMLLGIFGAALVGFLVYNSNPASIFMGDCGSLFIGFFLASAALISPTGGRTRSFLPVLAVPVLCLFVPIFDTMLVMVLRKLAGRAVSRGGRDHTSHRLVTLGLSERRAVFMLYGLATLSGALAMVVRDTVPDLSIAAIVGFTTAAGAAGGPPGERQGLRRGRGAGARTAAGGLPRGRVVQAAGLRGPARRGADRPVVLRRAGPGVRDDRRPGGAAESSWASCPSWSPSRSRRCWRRGSTAASGGT